MQDQKCCLFCLFQPDFKKTTCVTHRHSAGNTLAEKRNETNDFFNSLHWNVGCQKAELPSLGELKLTLIALISFWVARLSNKNLWEPSFWRSSKLLLISLSIKTRSVAVAAPWTGINAAAADAAATFQTRLLRTDVALQHLSWCNL